ncbi:choice-of-anchor P family protein [Nocardioides mangrovi]|uniref:Uncharacterized protein n=1 Tax=Nocardioides mangrovi TaxID=2874580 RepID=A0ABS7UA43_9ACTN|nr:choice-of-anchor P family protein [Nocardioides mangrovi]MBZ5737858.1 hypothetical protein [Nocardioides mangrovi]
MVNTWRSPALLTAAVAVLGLTAGLGVSTANAATGSAPQRVKPRTVATAFALQSAGYATKIKGGQVPAQSGTTAWDVIGCTNEAGTTNTNDVTDVQLPGLGTVGAGTTKLWTTSKKGTVSSWARHSVGDIVLSDSPLGTLSIKAVTTTARAYHNASGFHTSTNTDVGKLSFAAAGGLPPVDLPIPAPGQPVDIPGFATITIGHSNTHDRATQANAYANGLKVELTASGTSVHIAHAEANLYEGIKTGIFKGSSTGLTGDVGSGTLNLGKNLLSRMPCQGTDGKVVSKSAAGVDLGGQVVVGAAKNTQFGKQTARKATGYERSQIASVDLGGGALHIDGIVAKAKVTRANGKLVRSSDGTTLGAITANGEPQQIPDTGVLEIPGVASIQPGVVKKTAHGLRVVGLRITLLDGTGATIDLATAKLDIARPS